MIDTLKIKLSAKVEVKHAAKKLFFMKKSLKNNAKKRIHIKNIKFRRINIRFFS